MVKNGLGYLHNCRAAYPHIVNGRADKRRNRRDCRADSLCYRYWPGVQLLGSTAKNIAESCEISPYVTLKEKSTSPYFLRFQKFTFDLITVIHLFDCLKLSNNARFRPRRHS